MKKIITPKIKLGFWTISPIIIGVFVASLVLNNVSYLKSTNNESNSGAVIEAATQIETEKIPEYFYFIKDVNKKPKVSALAYIVGDLDTGEVILQKNEKTQFPIASVSKLMTAIVASELVKEDSVAQVSKTALATYGKNGNLRIGEKIKVSELIYPLLLESSNDAAEVIAEFFDRNTFIKKMNQQAKILDLSSTSFEDPSGLSAKNQSTVYDLFKLSGFLKQKKQELLQTTLTRSYTNKLHAWASTNQFLHETGYLGGKSGYTDPAKQTVISLFSVPLSKDGNRNIAITLLQTVDRYKDVQSIVKYLKQNVYYGGAKDANADWVKQKEGIPDIAEPDFINLTFAGDIMLDRGVKNSVMKNFEGDYSKIFEKINTFQKSDISFANLEGPVSDQGRDLRNLYSFRMSPSVLPALKGAGLDIVSVANNHMGDWGRDAYTDTLAGLKENEILYTGGGNNSQEAEQPTIIEKYGLKIGYIGFSDKGPDSMKATDNQSGLLLANNPRFADIIKEASQKVDYLVVSFHFGEEYQTKHNSRQELLAHRAVDNGAKIVIGHHPHVIQDTEVYKNGFIAYSLGNFVFDQYFSQNTMQGMLLEIKLGKDGSMTIKKNTVKLNKVFQLDSIIKGKEEKLKITNITT